MGYRSGDQAGRDRVLIWWSSVESRGLIQVPLTKMNVLDSSLAEAPPDHHQSSTRFHSGCETLWLVGLSRSPSNHQMSKCWAKLKIGLIREDELTPVLYSPILMVFCKPQPDSSLLLIDERLISSFARLQPCLQEPVSNHPLLALHPCRLSLDFILQLLSDIQMSWWSSQSVESHFCP